MTQRTTLGLMVYIRLWRSCRCCRCCDVHHATAEH